MVGFAQLLWVLGEGGDRGNQSAKSKVAHIIVARKQSKKKKKDKVLL